MLEDMMQALRAQPAVSSSFGLVVGTVKNNYDKNEAGKVQVEYSLGEQGKVLTGWIPVLAPYTAAKGGMYFLPETGTEVVVGFLGGRTDCPVVLGSLWSKNVERPQNAVNEKNLTKVLRTKGGHELRFSDEDKKQKLTVETPGSLTIDLSDEKKTVIIHDKEKKNSITIDGQKGEIKLDADKKLVISIGGTAAITVEKNKITLKSGTVEIDASQTLNLKGQSLSAKGSQVTVKADGTLNISASGITQIKGSMVKIN